MEENDIVLLGFELFSSYLSAEEDIHHHVRWSLIHENLHRFLSYCVFYTPGRVEVLRTAQGSSSLEILVLVHIYYMNLSKSSGRAYYLSIKCHPCPLQILHSLNQYQQV